MHAGGRDALLCQCLTNSATSNKPAPNANTVISSPLTHPAAAQQTPPHTMAKKAGNMRSSWSVCPGDRTSSAGSEPSRRCSSCSAKSSTSCGQASACEWGRITKIVCTTHPVRDCAVGKLVRGGSLLLLLLLLLCYLLACLLLLSLGRLSLERSRCRVEHFLIIYLCLSSCSNVVMPRPLLSPSVCWAFTPGSGNRAPPVIPAATSRTESPTTGGPVQKRHGEPASNSSCAAAPTAAGHRGAAERSARAAPQGTGANQSAAP
jgi:hypothetical protein